MVKNDFSIEERDMTLEEVREALARYEQQYDMPSQEFYAKWKKGETYAVAESVDWSLLFEAYQVMNGKDSHARGASNGHLNLRSSFPFLSTPVAKQIVSKGLFE